MTAHLTPLEQELLDYLRAHEGEYVDPKRVPIIGLEKEKTVNVYVHGLRKKLGHHVISTRYGKGYRYEGEG